VGDTSVVVRVGGAWRGREFRGRGSAIAVVLGEGGVLRHKYEDVIETRLGRKFEGGGDIYWR
jgi:hypothetical protein